MRHHCRDIDTSKDRATGACCSTTEDTASFHEPKIRVFGVEPIPKVSKIKRCFDLLHAFLLETLWQNPQPVLGLDAPGTF